MPFIIEAVIESLIGTSIAVGFGWALIEYSKSSVVADSIFDITISDDYLIFLTISLLMFSIIFGLFASFVGIRKALYDLKNFDTNYSYLFFYIVFISKWP